MTHAPASSGWQAPAGTWTASAPHVRDIISVRGVARGFAVALLPCLLAALHHVGRQAALAAAALETAPAPGWRDAIRATLGRGRDPSRLDDCLLLGLLQLGPLLVTCLVAGACWQQLFAVLRRRPASVGLLSTALIVTLAVPSIVSPWQLAIAMSLGIVLAQEVFGGTGMNVVHPALLALACLTLSDPALLRGGAIDSPIAGLPIATSALAWALGAGYLLARRLICWRVLAGGALGLLATAAASGLAEPVGPLELSSTWLPAMGVFAFGLVFVATDPASSAATPGGRWVYGCLVGVATVVLRLATPAGSEAVFPAILLANLTAPLIDHVVVAANIRRRRRRHV